jgi:hypothetical protein
MLIVYRFMPYINYVILIMSLWDLYYLVAILAEFDMDSLLLFPHTPDLRKVAPNMHGVMEEFPED